MHCYECDISKTIDIKNFLAKLSAQNVYIDILVNNAGIELVKPIEDIDLSEWQSVQNINVDGVFLGCKTLLALLKKTGLQAKTGASIINISSVAGIVAFANQLAYNTSKGAVRHLSKSLAVEFAEKRYNIRVNSVHPGYADTPLTKPLFANEDALALRLNKVPLGRIGTADEIANGIIYLASDESSFVTGSELVIDGGMTAQ